MSTRDATSLPGTPGGLRSVLEEVERELLATALRDSHGNKAQAARALGITERLMGIRVAKLGIDWRSLRRARHESRRSG